MIHTFTRSRLVTRGPPADGSWMGAGRGTARSRLKVALNGASVVVAVGLLVVAVRHFSQVGWPLAGANPRLVGAAALLFLLAYAFKAAGWQRLFRPANGREG